MSSNIWSKYHPVDPERMAEALKCMPANGPKKIRHVLENEMKEVVRGESAAARGNLVRLSAKDLPTIRTIQRWIKLEKPPNPQSNCLIQALFRLTGVDVSLHQVANANQVDFARMTSLSVYAAGPLNEADELQRVLWAINLNEFRTYDLTENYTGQTDVDPKKVMLGFEEARLYLNIEEAQIVNDKPVFAASNKSGEWTTVDESIQIVFNGYSAKSWTIDSCGKRKSMNGYIHQDTGALCIVSGNIGDNCSARILCRAEDLSVNIVDDDTSEKQQSALKHFKSRLKSAVIKDDILPHPGYYVLLERLLRG